LNGSRPKDPSARDLLRIFRRRRSTIFITVAVFTSIAGLFCIFTTRQYQAKSVIQLQKSNSDSLNLDSLTGASAAGTGDSLSANVDLQTQSNILQSDTLASQVISDLKLEDRHPYKLSASEFSTFNAAKRRDHLLTLFNKNLSVHVVPGTRLIEVDFTDPDPDIAADVANHLVQGLIDYTFQTKFNATNEASHWLENQLGDLRHQSEALQSKVVAVQKSTGLFGVGTTDPQGKPIVFSPILDRLQASTATLSQAEMNRILKGSVYEVAKTGSADLISQLSGTTVAAGTSQGVTDSLSLIENLRTQEAALGAQVARDETIFGSEYPRLKEERASLARVHELLQSEITRIAQRTKNDYDIALKTSEGARANFQRDQEAAEKLNDRTIEYTLLAKEADQSQALYQDLLRRLKEAGILEGLRSSNITVVDPAHPPSKPSKPRVLLYLLLGFGIGIPFALVAALFIDSIDSKLQDTSDIEALALPLLGIAPIRENNGTAIDPSTSPYSEGIRRLRSSILISRSTSPPQVILITSSSAKEGKSTLALNLAVSFASLNKTALLIEADLRRPVMRERLGLPGSSGLSSLLASSDSIFEPLLLEAHPNLSLLPGGPIPPFPAELLGSPRLQSLITTWRTQFDIIIIDSPPVLPVTDAEILEDHADATLLIARAGTTARIALQSAYSLIMPHAAHAGRANVGIVLNAVRPSSAAQYGYYGNNRANRFGKEGAQ
jgi:succinoglycan biosynthesis transport protein ExoP